MKITAVDGERGTIVPITRAIVEVSIEGHRPVRLEWHRIDCGSQGGCCPPVGGHGIGGDGTDICYVGSFDLAALEAERDALFPVASTTLSREWLAYLESRDKVSAHMIAQFGSDDLEEIMDREDSPL